MRIAARLTEKQSPSPQQLAADRAGQHLSVCASLTSSAGDLLAGRGTVSCQLALPAYNRQATCFVDDNCQPACLMTLTATQGL